MELATEGAYKGELNPPEDNIDGTGEDTATVTEKQDTWSSRIEVVES